MRVSRSVIPAAPEAALRGWLFQIARNLALDHHRRGQRRPPAEPLTDTARPASQDTGAEVNEALASLADVDRDVFLMREVAGLGYDEIATACGLTPDAVRSRIHRARLQLRDRLSTQIALRQASPMRRPVAPTDAMRQLPAAKRVSTASHASELGGAPASKRKNNDRHTRRHFSFSGRRTLRCRGARRGAERSRGTGAADRPGGAPPHRPAGRARRNRSGRNTSARDGGRCSRRPRCSSPWPAGMSSATGAAPSRAPSRRRQRASCRKPPGKFFQQEADDEESDDPDVVRAADRRCRRSAPKLPTTSRSQ